MKVFPKRSPLVRDVSSAILQTTEGEKMTDIQKAWFDSKASCSSETSQFSSTRLSLKNFAGLFYITGAVSVAALLCFICQFFYTSWGKVTPEETPKGLISQASAFVKQLDMRDPSSIQRSAQHAENTSSREESQRGDLEQGISPSADNQNTHGSVSNEDKDSSSASRG